MRFEAIRAVYEYGKACHNFCFITGDYGHAKTNEFRKEFAGLYFNAGMSEQHIIGMAAGLALTGIKTVVYSIAPFITLRCLEQIKIDLCEHEANVIIIGGGGGLAYGTAGITHYSVEEIAALRAMPNIKIVCPADPTETYVLIKQLLEEDGPAYVRIGRGGEQSLPISADKSLLGKGAMIREGKDIVIFSSGTILSETLHAAEILLNNNIEVGIINLHTLKPLDADIIINNSFGKTGVFTVEEHVINGGLGGAVAEILLESHIRPKIFRRFGLQNKWPKRVGSQNYLREWAGISGKKIAESIAHLLSV